MLCNEDRIQAILKLSQQASAKGLEALKEAMVDFPEDPRLHFLRGSLLIDVGRLIEAHSALKTAVMLAPDYHIARFQLGFFELTSGEAQAARDNWSPLTQALPSSHYLSLFVCGLEALIEDRFADCVQFLQQGIAANIESSPLNSDMSIIIEKCSQILSDRAASNLANQGDDFSAASLLLTTRRH